MKITTIFLILGLLPFTSVAEEKKKENLLKKIANKINFQPETVPERLALKGGVGIINRKVKGSFKTEDTFRAGGFTTQFTYVHNFHWELAAGSYIYWGNAKELEFEINQNRVQGDGSFRSMTISPTLKYVFDLGPANKWHFYLTGGPAWSIQTLKLKEFTDTTGENRKEHKITYESAGFVAGFGIQEMLPFKSMHPVYVEFLYSRMKAYKASLVDASNTIEVETISYEDKQSDINGNIFMLNIGMTIF